MSVRSDIFSNIVSTLEGIDGSGSFETEVDGVFPYDIQSPDVQGGNLFLGVFFGVHSRTTETRMGGVVQVFNTLRVNIRGHVTDSSDEVVTTAESLMADVERALLADRRRGQTNSTIDTVALDIQSFAPIIQGSAGLVSFLAEVTITWVSTLGTP